MTSSPELSTTVPSAAIVAHDGTSLGEPFTRTTQTRHEVCGVQPSMKHIDGMLIPAPLAAARIVDPGFAVISLPSIVSFGIYVTCIESTGHTCLHVSQRMHFDWSISCFLYGFISIASAGHFWAHFVHPMQVSLIE